MAIAGAISLNWVLLVAIAASLFSGCAKLNDAISQAQKKDVAQGARAPNIAETGVCSTTRIPPVESEKHGIQPSAGGFQAPLC